MKLLVGGSDPALLAAAAKLGALSIAELAAGASAEEAVILLEVSTPERARDEVTRLVESGLAVIAAATNSSSDVRAAALGAGAREVVLPPPTATRLRDAVEATVGRPGRRHVRFEATFPAVIEVPGQNAVAGKTVDIARRGLRMVIDRGLERGVLVRAGVALPAPARLPVQFARVVDCNPTEEGRFQVRLRLIAVSGEDDEILTAFLRTLDPPPTPPEVAFQAILALENDQLGDADTGVLAGARAPPLLLSERAALQDDSLPAASEVMQVALARFRAALLETLLEANPTLGSRLRDEQPELEEELRRAEDRARALLAAAVEGDPQSVKERREQQQRLTVAAEKLRSRLAALSGRRTEKLTASSLQEMSQPVTFDKPSGGYTPVPAPDDSGPAKAPRRRSRMPYLVVGNALALGAVAALFLTSPDHSLPANASMVANPVRVLTPGSIRIKSLFPEGATEIAVVDGSWYEASDTERRAAVRELLAHPPKGAEQKPLNFRDLTGEVVAYTTKEGRVLVRQDPTRPKQSLGTR